MRPRPRKGLPDSVNAGKFLPWCQDMGPAGGVNAETGTTCGGCGGPLDAATATYDTEGNLRCRACAARADIAAGDDRAAKSLAGIAGSVFLGGVLSLTCLNVFFLLSIVTLVTGVSWLVTLLRSNVHQARLGGTFVPCLLGVCAGIIAATLSLLAAIFPMLGSLLSRAP